MSSATMTPPSANPGATLEEDELAARGQDAWAIAWRQYKKNKLAVVALWLIGALFVVAVFAPFLANDLPLYVRAALPAKYESAFFAYDALAAKVPALLAGPRAGAKPEEKRAHAERLEQACEGVLARLESAADLVADDQRALLLAARDDHARLLDAARAAGGKLDKEAWSAIRERLEPLSPDTEPRVVKVVPRTFFPVFRGLDRTEIYFLGLFLTVLASPLLLRVLDAWGRRRLMDPFNLAFWKLGLVLGLPLAIALVTPALFPRKEDPDRKGYKKIQADAGKKGDVDTVVIFPPVAFGENENILEDQRSKPTWLLSEEERAARVVPALVKKRDERRERLALESVPALVQERTLLAQALDRAKKEHLKRNIFRRAWDTLFPSAEVATPTARLAIVEAEISKAVAAQATDLDDEIRKAYAERKGELRWHWLGTDTNGRDVLSRMVYGARVSMSVGFVAESIAVAIGILLGALAGYFRGWVDIALSRVIEVVICFPTFFFILTILAFLPQSILNIMIVIGITGWPGIARLMRAEFLRLSNLDFVTAGKALGLSDARIIFRHILPNGIAPILVSTTFGIAGAILVESALSFLGFGVPQPTASWGDTLNNGAADPQGTWWLTVFPGTALFLTVTAYNLVGDAIRDATDPRLRQ